MVHRRKKKIHRRDAENAENAERIVWLLVFPFSGENKK